MTEQTLKALTTLVKEQIINELTAELILDYIKYDELTNNITIDFRYNREFNMSLFKFIKK